MEHDIKPEKYRVQKVSSGGTVGYLLAMIGAAAYYLHRASGFEQVLVALLKALVWPAFLVYHLLRL